MKISARERNCESFDSARADMDSLRVVSAGDHCLCLYLYDVFLCLFERKLIEVVVIDSAPIHKADDCTLAESANTLFAVNAGDIIEVTFGNRPIKVRVLSDEEPRTKDVAREMYEVIAE